MNNTLNLGFIGGGNMASSLIGGLANADSNLDAQNIWVFDLDATKCDDLVNRFGVNAAKSNQQLVEQCDVVVCAVKPQVLQKVLSPLTDTLQAKKPLLISVVAGIEISSMEKWIGAPMPVIRVMPNTPALIGVGASGLFANGSVSQQQKDFTSTLISSVGILHWCDDEAGIDSVTALSGSGPAYFMLFIQSLIEAGVANGLSEQGAKDLAVQTAIGAAQLIKQSDSSIATLIDNVTSPNGTTEQALLSFKDSGLAETVTKAFTAAKHRSEEMAVELGSS